MMLSRKGVHESHYGENKGVPLLQFGTLPAVSYDYATGKLVIVSVENPHSKSCKHLQEIEDYEHVAAVATSGNVKLHKLCKQKIVDYPSVDNNSTPSDGSSVEDPYSKEFAKQESSKQEIEDHEHAAAVATNGNFKAHKFFPVAKEVAKEESCKQKIVDYPSDDTNSTSSTVEDPYSEESCKQEIEDYPSDDTNSTSGTVEYPYSEEGYPSDDVYSGDEDYKDDESEGDEDEKDEGMTDSKDEIEDDDFGAVFSREGLADSTDEDDDFGAVFSREGMADSTDEIEDDDSGAASSLVSGSDVSHKKRQDKDEWFASWKKLGLQQHWTWVNVYAYYNKVKGYGGYGVVLRNAAAQPIAASAVFSKDGKYFFYQVLVGIMAGVELAEKNGFSNLYVRCNSFKVPRMFGYVRNCSNDKCRDQNSVCGNCSNFFAWHYGCDRRVMPLVLGLKCKDIVVDVVSSWGKNAAAHYLAGMAKENRKVKGVLDMEPKDFPEKLNDILWEDLSDYNRVVE